MRLEEFVELQKIYHECTKIHKAYHPDKPVYRAECERSKGYLYSIGLIASGSIGTYKDFDLIATVLNNLPELLEAYAEKHVMPLLTFEPHIKEKSINELRKERNNESKL